MISDLFTVITYLIRYAYLLVLIALFVGFAVAGAVVFMFIGIILQTADIAIMETFKPYLWFLTRLGENIKFTANLH